VKLLFDENLSFRLPHDVADIFPDCLHVRDVGLARASDDEVWDYATSHDLAIVSKDADFHGRSVLRGPPPKVIWIRRGNCSTSDIEQLLRLRRSDIETFLRDPIASFLALS